MVIDTIPTLVWSARRRFRRLYQPTLGRIHGTVAEEGLGWKLEELHPDDGGRFMNEWLATLSSGEPMRIEVRVPKADGEYRC